MRAKLHCENRQKAVQRSWTIFNDKREAVKAVVGRGLGGGWRDFTTFDL